MGRKNKGYSKTLRQQIYEKLISMQAFGDNKQRDKDLARSTGTDTMSGKIYSFSTFNSYWKHAKQFISWMKQEHPECSTMKKAKTYISEWLDCRMKEGKSAWTIHLEAAALNKIFGIKKDDPERFEAPHRNREDISRSRGSKVRDKHFSEKSNELLVNFCKCCGFRRGVLEKIKGKDLYTRQQLVALLKDSRNKGDKKTFSICLVALKSFPDQNYFVFHRQDKGGKSRIAPVIGEKKAVDMVVTKFRETAPDELVWRYVNTNCDVHGYRSIYATELYKLYARDVTQLNFHTKILCSDGKYRSELYICRKDEPGKKLDRKALHLVSVALGHNREDTAISSYIRNL